MAPLVNSFHPLQENEQQFSTNPSENHPLIPKANIILVWNQAKITRKPNNRQAFKHTREKIFNILASQIQWSLGVMRL